MLAALYILIIVVVIVDVVTVTKNAYNLVSLAGIVIYVAILFVFSYNPAKVWMVNCLFILISCYIIIIR